MTSPGRHLPEISTCFGGGGFFAIAFGMGVADGLADAGVEVRAHPMLGTSGGAWAAAALATQIGMADIVRATAETSGPAADSRTRPQTDVTHDVFGDARNELVSTVAIHLSTGRRTVLRGPDTELADAVGASSAAPGLFPPYRIGGRRFVDAGIYSSTSAHLAAAARMLIVIAPMAGPVLRPLGTVIGHVARNEATLWRLRHRGRVVHITPDGALAALAGRGIAGLLDPAAAPLVYHSARRLGRLHGDALAEPNRVDEALAA